MPRGATPATAAGRFSSCTGKALRFGTDTLWIAAGNGQTIAPGAAAIFLTVTAVIEGSRLPANNKGKAESGLREIPDGRSYRHADRRVPLLACPAVPNHQRGNTAGQASSGTHDLGPAAGAYTTTPKR